MSLMCQAILLGIKGYIYAKFCLKPLPIFNYRVLNFWAPFSISKIKNDRSNFIEQMSLYLIWALLILPNNEKIIFSFWTQNCSLVTTNHKFKGDLRSILRSTCKTGKIYMFIIKIFRVFSHTLLIIIFKQFTHQKTRLTPYFQNLE